MTMLKIYLIRFKTPYHVGWRKPRKIIDHITVLRALLNISFTLGIRKVPEEIVNGAVKSSAILLKLDIKFARTLRVSTSTSLLLTASMEFSISPSNPSREAVLFLSMGMLVPPIGPAPRGLRFTLL